MDIAPFDRLEQMAKEPAAIERSVEYVTRQLRLFAKKGSRILICFPNDPGSLGEILHKAVMEVEAIPVHWGDDPRWLTLIRTVFVNKINAVIGPPLVLLGLNKLSKVTRTPLYVRHALIAGHSAFEWLLDGIVRGLDCKTWGYFAPNGRVIMCGQSCGESLGVHIRQEEYDIEIVDDDGNSLPDGQLGEICIIPKHSPDLRVCLYERARIDRTPCPCGRDSARLIDFEEGRDCDLELHQLAAELHRWDSVLDVRLQRGDCGLELEAVVFPGLELPQFPNCAKMVVRNWDPERDVPFWVAPSWRYSLNSSEND